MQRKDPIYQQYLDILRRELIPATGCTEPIAVALASAKAREVLGCMPEEIVAECSGNVIKNVKGVVVPGTGDMRGIETSAILGAVAGDSALNLDVLSKVTAEDVNTTRRLLEQGVCRVGILADAAGFQVVVTAKANGHSALVELYGTHTNMVRVEKDGEVLRSVPVGGNAWAEQAAARSFMSVEGIYDFANSVMIEDVAPILDMQIKYNTCIAEEGLQNRYGSNVGCTLLETGEKSVRTRARAYAAAGSDARMGGCTLPVIINSGSGNQGLTASLPVIQYAEHLGCGKEKQYRALLMSNLTAIHLKTGIGCLSAYCGAVSAACGAGVGIGYLQDAGLEVINQAIINMLGNVSGIVCDGAKASCAAKIASAVDAALLALDMALCGRGFASGEGIVMATVEETVRSVGRLARCGMRETDLEILRIMVEDPAS